MATTFYPAGAGGQHRTWRNPLLLALALAVLGALKPPAVDDAAYLALARQVAARPLDPYGFRQFWGARPAPALEVLAPPVLPYWMALGVALAPSWGESEFGWVGLKLWMLPWHLLFAFALRSLARAFVPGSPDWAVLSIAASAGALPFWNLMLDLPAAALSLAALAAVASDKPSCGRALAAGLLLGAAVQTKYSALGTLPVLLAFGIAGRSFGRALAALLVAVAVAAAWECWLVDRYGDSHFLLCARLDALDYPPGVQLARKLAFVKPHLCYLGGLGWVWGLLGLRAAGLPGRAVVALAILALAGIGRILLVPPEWGNPGGAPSSTPRFEATTDFFAALGLLTVAGVGAAALAPLWSWRIGFRALTPARRLGWLLLAWWLAEAAAVGALSPFPAGRRLVMLGVVTGLIVCRAVVLFGRLDAARRRPSWLVALGVVFGVGVAAFDTREAWAEPAVLRRCLALAGEKSPGARVWTSGHWGWQEWAHRRGVRLILPGGSRLEVGDVVIEPVAPLADPDELFRPAVRRAAIDFGPGAVEWFAEVTCDDRVPGQTLPALYGGDGPLFGRDFPRLKARVGVVRRAFVGEPVFPPPA